MNATPDPSPQSSVRVLVVSDDPLARGGLAALLAGQPGLAIVAQASSGEVTAPLLRALAPDVVAWDVGAEAADRFRPLEQAESAWAALVPDEGAAAEALSAGATAALLRDAPGPRLSAALRAAAEGLVVLDPAFSQALLRPRPQSSAGGEQLTPRELEVLQQLAQGLSNKEIGQRLSISDHTAKFHVNAILAKLDAQSRTEAVVRAAQRGLLIL